MHLHPTQRLATWKEFFVSAEQLKSLVCLRRAKRFLRLKRVYHWGAGQKNAYYTTGGGKRCNASVILMDECFGLSVMAQVCGERNASCV